MNQTKLAAISSQLTQLRKQIERLEAAVASYDDGDDPVEGIRPELADFIRSTIVSALEEADERGLGRNQLYKAIKKATGIRYPSEYPYGVEVSACQLSQLLEPMIACRAVSRKRVGSYYGHACIRYWLAPCSPLQPKPKRKAKRQPKRDIIPSLLTGIEARPLLLFQKSESDARRTQRRKP